MMEGDDKAKAEEEIAAKVAGGASKPAAAAAAGGDDYPPKGLSAGVKKLEEWIQVGCGDKPYHCEEKKATFPSDKCPDKLPDLSEHSNCMTDFFKKNPEVYDTLKDKVTKSGVNLAQCIKTGMDNPGHPMIKTVGLTAGDEESYEVFKELFDPIISDRHNGYKSDAKHPTDLDTSKLSSVSIDPTGKYVVSTRVRTGRSIRGLRLPPTCAKSERREVERVVTTALLSLSGEMQGEYYPLSGSFSFGGKSGGMSKAEEDLMREDHFLFQEPES